MFLLQVIKSNRVIGAAATVLWDIAFADSRHCVQLVGVALIAAASLLPHTTPMPPPYLFCCQCMRPLLLSPIRLTPLNYAAIAIWAV